MENLGRRRGGKSDATCCGDGKFSPLVHTSGLLPLNGQMWGPRVSNSSPLAPRLPLSPGLEEAEGDSRPYRGHPSGSPHPCGTPRGFPLPAGDSVLFLHSTPHFPFLIRIFLLENIVDQTRHFKAPCCQGGSAFLGPIMPLRGKTWARDLLATGIYSQLNICANFYTEALGKDQVRYYYYFIILFIFFKN